MDAYLKKLYPDGCFCPVDEILRETDPIFGD
jgi:hypothetical protein